jgi:hypothetical protein
VVVGGEVVVEVGGDVVGSSVDSTGAPGPAVVVVVVGVGVVVGGEVVVVGSEADVDVVETWEATSLEEALEPGCSLATTTPMTTVAPVAKRATERVRRRRRTSACLLASGEFRGGGTHSPYEKGLTPT